MAVCLCVSKLAVLGRTGSFRGSQTLRTPRGTPRASSCSKAAGSTSVWLELCHPVPAGEGAADARLTSEWQVRAFDWKEHTAGRAGCAQSGAAVTTGGLGTVEALLLRRKKRRVADARSGPTVSPGVPDFPCGRKSVEKELALLI